MAERSRIEELRRRVQMDPASIAFAALAEEYRRAGNFEDAIATCQAGLQRHPAYLSARVTLGRSLVEIGRYDEARHELEHVLRVAPENLAAIRALAEIHDRDGDYLPPRSIARTPAAVTVSTPAAVPSPPPPAPVAVPPPAAAPAPAPIAIAAAPAAPSPMPVHVPHPDEAALPKLEAFLTAIAAARSMARRR